MQLENTSNSTRVRNAVTQKDAQRLPEIARQRTPITSRADQKRASNMEKKSYEINYRLQISKIFQDSSGNFIRRNIVENDEIMMGEQL